MKKFLLAGFCVLMSLVSAYAEGEFRLVLGTDAVTVIPDDNVKKWCLIAVTQKNSDVLWNSSVNRANMQALGFDSPTPECIYTWKVWANASSHGEKGFVNAKFGQLTLNYENIPILNDRDYKGEPFTFVISYVQKTSENFGYEIISDLTMVDFTYDPGFTFHPNWYTNSEDSTFYFNPNDPNVEYWYAIINEKNRKDSTDQQIWERAANPTTFFGVGDIEPLKGYDAYITLAGYKGGDHSVIFAGIETKSTGLLGSKRVPKGDVHRFTFTPDADVVKENPKDTVIVVPPSAVKDTLEYTTTDILPEVSDNEGTYVYSIFSLDGKWKTQINYNSTSRYGHFTDEDFNLSGSGANYNYIRNAKNSMEFYSFKKLDVTVEAGANGETNIEINGLINPNYYQKDVYRRVLIHATLPSYTPTDTINIDLGHAYISSNEYLGMGDGRIYYTIEGYNKEYTLQSGFFAKDLSDATYLTSDLIMPYLVHKNGLTLDTLSLCAPCEHSMIITHEGDVHKFEYNIISEDIRLYHITFDDKVETIAPVDTVFIQCYNTQAYSVSEELGIYAYYGANDVYQVSIAVKKSAIENQNTVYNQSDINFDYSLVFNNKTNTQTKLNSATATLVDNGDQTYDLRADLIGRDQILYKVAMPIGYTVLPEVVDTVKVNMELGRIDYSTGVPGVVGIVGYNTDGTELHAYFYNEGKLEGDFRENLFFYDGFSYLTRTTESTYRFTDITWANAKLTKEGDVTHMNFLVYTLTNEMFSVSIDMQELEFLTQDTYSIDYYDGVSMVGIRDTVFANGDAHFTVQFQYAEGFDNEGEPYGDQRYFTFQFVTHDSLSLAGTYGYSDETLNINKIHMLVEDNVELYLGVMAGTFSLKPAYQLQVADIYGKPYNTYVYDAYSQFVGENGIVYTLDGQGIALVVDGLTGKMVNLKEDLTTTDLKILDMDGNVLKKQLINGQLVIEFNGRRYTVLGQ